MSNPPATMLWRRERFTISEGTPHMQIYGTEGKSVLEVTPMSDRDFGRYNCTARNNIGVRYQEFILAQAGALILSLMRSMPSVFSPDRMENTIHIFSQPVCNPLPPYQ
ncbi:hypothetical protein XENOCAPTIV_027761 [Xenoophorus captivus]|uniref:Ig-like domain-containing protein n=1 Tax=Xenoophorus captivus TaxID=1517983 RepID=A0ABV0QPP0_9TELE